MKTEITQGLRAGLALMNARPKDIVRVAFSRASARMVEPATRALRLRGVSCRMLSDPELDKLARAPQHEGLIVEAKPREWVEVREIAERLRNEKSLGVALDHVKNPYNVGAILRSAAFFGARGAILSTSPQKPALDAQAVRVAEGGVEHLLLAQTPRLAEALAELRKNRVRVIGADGHAKNDARNLRPPLVIVFGHEREGLHERVRAECDDLVAIHGSGDVESLNVAVAAGILIDRAVTSR